MLTVLLLSLLSDPTNPARIYSGRAGQLDVRMPRQDAEPVVDGMLGDTVWTGAAVLTGFSQFSPTDGVPAADSTEVLVWYSSSAIYFGIRAFEAHGAVHATLADRDRISADDNVQILLSTFNDSRQASVFAVNPFGVQSDGALVETGATSGNGFNNAVVKREVPDLSPDFVFESKGRLTPQGYEVEVRIPFKSLRFQPKREQVWGINIVRQVQHSGREDSWTPAKRASASFLAQSGRLVGLTDLSRGIVQPVAAAKLTGKAFGTDLGFLSAVDDPSASRTGDHPVYNLLRIQRDIGSQSRLGVVYTDKIDGSNYNRVAGADSRLVFGEVYSAQLQLAGSRTRSNGITRTAPLWSARVARSGRMFGARYSIAGVDEEFRAQSGFISRPGIVHANLDHSLTLYARPGGVLESFTADVALDGTWEYQRFVDGEGIQDQKLHFNTNTRLKGGWQFGASVLMESFGYPSDVYQGYAVELPAASGSGTDTVPFVGRPTIPNLDYVLTLDTPQFAHFSGNLFFLWGHDENFYEWASANITWLNLTLDWRPTDKLRLNGFFPIQYVGRRTDGSTVELWKSPRLKLEYQLSRPIFLRLVGEYTNERRDALRDDTRTNAPILILDPETDTYVRSTPFGHRSFRGDFLFSYQPNPGTVVFAGYGSTLRDPTELGRSSLRRMEDGFFLKLSYLFRM
jgi:hypothetical protein